MNEFTKWFTARVGDKLMDHSIGLLAQDIARAAWGHQQEKIDALQAKVDELMLEYCHEEITDEQLAEYESRQRPCEK